MANANNMIFRNFIYTKTNWCKQNRNNDCARYATRL